jgi:hypothetical protein
VHLQSQDVRGMAKEHEGRSVATNDIVVVRRMVMTVDTRTRRKCCIVYVVWSLSGSGHSFSQ